MRERLIRFFDVLDICAKHIKYLGLDLLLNRLLKENNSPKEIIVKPIKHEVNF